MILKLDHFYHDKTHGVMRFSGYDPDGGLLFDKWVRSGEGKWMKDRTAKVAPDYHRLRASKGYLRPIPPPQ